MPTNIQQLASALDVIRRIDRDDALHDSNPAHWQAVHGAWRELRDAIMRGAPSGSGIDCGTVLAEERGAAERVVFAVSFHHMNEHGMYDGWSAHYVTITPAFDGVAVKVGGRDRNGIKDYLADTYYHWATAECPHKFTLPPRDEA